VSGSTTANTFSATNVTASGNLTFTGTGNRITGDMSNATHANRVAFQSSTTNGSTSPFFIPNGTGTTASIIVANASDPTNSSYGQLRVSGNNAVDLISARLGTGTDLPMTFITGGSERMRIDTSGNVGIGVVPSAWRTSDRKNLQVDGGALSAGNTFSVLYANAYLDASAVSRYVYTGSASNYAQSAVGHVWSTAVSGTAGDAISFSERMRIDSSGNLLVGKTAPESSERLGVKSSGNTSSTYGARFDNSSGTAIFMLRDDGYVRSPTTYNLTGGTANLSIDASGFITRSTSSLRYKRDIETYNKGLNAVATLRPVFYKSSVIDASGNLPDTQFAGLIAEELHDAGFSEFVEYNEQGQPDAVRYGNMVSLAFKAIQEQQAIIESLKTRIEALEAQA
jgi:hypothetical protein